MDCPMCPVFCPACGWRGKPTFSRCPRCGGELRRDPCMPEEEEPEITLTCHLAVVCGDVPVRKEDRYDTAPEYLGVCITPDNSWQSALRALKQTMIQNRTAPQDLVETYTTITVRFYTLTVTNDPDSPWLVDFQEPELQDGGKSVLYSADIWTAWEM